jgi:hypothetical protein
VLTRWWVKVLLGVLIVVLVVAGVLLLASKAGATPRTTPSGLTPIEYEKMTHPSEVA